MAISQPVIPADNMGYRRRMVQYAYLRFLGCSHCRSRDDEIHEQAEENAQGEREVKGKLLNLLKFNKYTFYKK